jgi:hypothetical protein
MAIYEALEDLQMSRGLVRKGETFEYDGKSEGKPGENMKLLRGKPVATAEPVPEELLQENH